MGRIQQDGSFVSAAWDQCPPGVGMAAVISGETLPDGGFLVLDGVDFEAKAIVSVSPDLTVNGTIYEFAKPVSSWDDLSGLETTVGKDVAFVYRDSLVLIDGAHSLPLELSGHDDRPRNTSELHELDSQLVVLETSNSSTADKPLLWRFERGKESITTLNPLHYDGTLSSGSVTVADDQHGGLLLLATAGYGENVPARLLYWPSGASIAKELSLPAEIVENDQLALVDLKDRIQLEVRGSSSIGEELRFTTFSIKAMPLKCRMVESVDKSTEKDLGALIKQGEISHSVCSMPELILSTRRAAV